LEIIEKDNFLVCGGETTDMCILRIEQGGVIDEYKRRILGL
jgi:hypothetical protein